MKPALHHLFDRVVCISLARCADRWHAFQRSIESSGTPAASVIRFEAVDGEQCTPPEWWRAGTGAWGCHQSHTRIFEQALQDHVQSLLVFEDDAIIGPDFPNSFGFFWEDLPDNWDGLLLGGQHLKRPLPVSRHVVRVINGHRTHAYAVRGRYLEAVYRHLCDYSAHSKSPREHVDHRLGKLHETLRFGIYAPRSWLVGQAAGFSAIRDQHMPQRFWNGRSSRIADGFDYLDSVELTKSPVVILGVNHHTTSYVARILHHLGFHLGARLEPPILQNERGLFESKWLKRQLQRLCDKPPRTELASREECIQILRQWLMEESRRAHSAGKFLAVKQPLLCFFGKELLEAWGKDVKILAVHIPLEECFRWADRNDGKIDAEQHPLIERLWESQELLLRSHNHLKIDFASLFTSPQSEIYRIIQYLHLRPIGIQIENAIADVKIAATD